MGAYRRGAQRQSGIRVRGIGPVLWQGFLVVPARGARRGPGDEELGSELIRVCSLADQERHDRVGFDTCCRLR